jgi:predicted dehydrogenase
MKPVTLLIVGAGGRGTGYATFAKAHPDQAQIVGVAEPRDFYRTNLVRDYAIPEGNIYTDWRQAASRPRFADAVLICTQDAMHVEPAVAFARLGYHILLEKPMAPDAAGCRAIVEAVRKAGVLFAVCHVMRYTAYTRKLRELLDQKIIGDLVSLQLLEPVGYWHQAHSFVRGPWRNTAQSSPMLLAKSCHDLDWISHIMGLPCEEVSSFGSLHHFRASQKPAGAADRCLDCPVEPGCPYSARRIYMSRFAKGNLNWPVNVVDPVPTEAGILAALRTGPYGRCVYACDNDVVDHQVVNFKFQGGRSGVFTMTAFTEMRHRQVRLFGTRGEITGDGEKIRIYDFLTETDSVVDTVAGDASILGGHGGGDFGLMDCFVGAVAKKDPSLILSGPEKSLESHLMVFASEKARLENRIVPVQSV